MSRGGERRLLERNGTFASRRVGLGFAESFGLYHYLLTTTWSRFLWIGGAAYVGVNALFGLGFLALGPGALSGSRAVSLGDRLAESFFFSVHTLATIGYGNLAPASLAANALVTVESLVGLLGVAVVAGVVFARVSRPTAGLKFSQVAVVAPYRDGAGLMFRVANARRTELINVQANISLSLLDPTGGRTFHQLTLERNDVMLLPTSWTVVHPIDRASPLWGLDRHQVAARAPELIILLTATEEVFFQTVHTRTSYAANEIVWGARFADILDRNGPGGVPTVDVSRLSETVPAAVPAIPGAALLGDDRRTIKEQSTS